MRDNVSDTEASLWKWYLWLDREQELNCKISGGVKHPQFLTSSVLVAFLQVCLKYYEYEFMELACQCPAVVCCRCTPTQKAQIVRLLQERTGKLTCAVGESKIETVQQLFHGVQSVQLSVYCF